MNREETARIDTAPNAGNDWMRLDNAAKIYPASGRKAIPPAFRLSVTLRESIHLRELNEALRRVVDRTPYYQVFIKRGFFWYYLERHHEYPTIRLLRDDPISSISLHTRNEHLIRVWVRDRTIAIDFSHVLTDGYGGSVFLGSLVIDYLRRLGHDVQPGGNSLDLDEPPSDEESDDAYQRIYARGTPPAGNLAPAYHMGGIPFTHGYRIITGRMPVTAALAAAKRYDATLTEYIVACEMHALKGSHDAERAGFIKPRSSIIRIEVPVNMRRVFPSRTMRNFSLFVGPEIDLRLGEYCFEEIVKRVHHEMNIQTEKNQLLRQIARNVGGERSRIVRIVPRTVKDLYLGHLRRTIGDRSYSGVVSNLGRVVLPADVVPHVDRVGFVLGPNPSYKVGTSVVSCGDTLYVTFGSVIADRSLERRFFRRLAADGVDVTVTEG